MIFNKPLLATPYSRARIAALDQIRDMSKKRISVIIVLCSALPLAVAVPSFLRSRGIAQLNTCIGQMYQIQSAKSTYALESDAEPGYNLTPECMMEYMASFFKDRGWNGFHCPSTASNTYTIGRIGDEPTCKFHGSFSEAIAKATSQQK